MRLATRKAFQSRSNIVCCNSRRYLHAIADRRSCCVPRDDGVDELRLIDQATESEKRVGFEALYGPAGRLDISGDTNDAVRLYSVLHPLDLLLAFRATSGRTRPILGVDKNAG